MKPAAFRYARPVTLDDALDILHRHEDGKVLAGGQSLVPLMNFRLARPDVLVDLSRVEELSSVREERDSVIVGAMVRQHELESSQLARTRCPLLVQALRWIGHVQIRNRGTIGGSIAHADPSAELPTAAVALDAVMRARSVRGERLIPAHEFFTGPFMTALEPDEILVDVSFSATDGARTEFVEVARRVGDFPIVAVAAVVKGDESAGDVGLAAGGIGWAPVRLTSAENAARGRPLDSETLDAVARAAADEVNPTSDIHADAQYRRDLTAVLVRRALQGNGNA